MTAVDVPLTVAGIVLSSIGNKKIKNTNRVYSCFLGIILTTLNFVQESATVFNESSIDVVS